MSEIVNKSFQKIINGSAVVSMGTAISLLLSFLARVIMVRFTTQSEYGIYSLSLTIISIFTIISALGLEDGATRYIAYLKGSKDEKGIQATIFSSILLVLMASVSVTFLIYLSSDYLETKIFNDPDISFTLRIMAISIPFTVLINIIVSIFRGFDNSSIRIYFNNILRPVVYLFLLGAAILFNRSFAEMISVYVISILVTFLALFIYFVRSPPISLVWKQVNLDHDTWKLLRFSIPLLTVSLLLTVMSWTDTLMLGYFKTAEIVAAYNAAYPLANLLSLGINSIGFLYMPIISNLYSKKYIKEIGVINLSSTKWCFIFTLPIFFALLVFPEFILDIFYGSQYVYASSVLQILAIGFIMNSFFGLNYYTLMATGESRLLMNCSLISAFVNIILNVILIPSFSMFGAAVASATSFTLIEIYMTLKMYQFLKIHPFTKIYIRFTILAILLISIFYSFRTLFIQTIWTIVAFYFLFLVVYAILVLYTKTLGEEDTEILVQIERKISANVPSIKRMLLLLK